MLKDGLFILLFLIIVNFAFAQKPDPNFTDKIALEESDHFKLKSTFTESENYTLSDLVYQRMEWQINPNVKYIKGSVTSYFKSQTQNLTEIEFDLNSLMTVDSVLQDKQKISFTHNNNKLVAQLNNPLQNNQLDSLRVFYQGEPKKNLRKSA